MGQNLCDHLDDHLGGTAILVTAWYQDLAYTAYTRVPVNQVDLVRFRTPGPDPPRFNAQENCFMKYAGQCETYAACGEAQ